VTFTPLLAIDHWSVELRKIVRPNVTKIAAK
jgi:hypothetical protein